MPTNVSHLPYTGEDSSFTISSQSEKNPKCGQGGRANTC